MNCFRFRVLRFCVFDEPTYGVDAESREKLGDALLESQRAAQLEQLILVSHDDAFDGKIENAIFLRKTAAHGTEVVEFPKPVIRRETENSLPELDLRTGMSRTTLPGDTK